VILALSSDFILKNLSFFEGNIKYNMNDTIGTESNNRYLHSQSMITYEEKCVLESVIVEDP
jgi:hypothetical protein